MNEPVRPVGRPTATLDALKRLQVVGVEPPRPLVNGEPVYFGLAYAPDSSMADFLEWLERDARAKSYAFENSFEPRLPQGFTDHYYPPTRRELREARRVEAAMRLAPDYETLVALFEGKAVPRQRLRKDVLDTVDRMRRG